MPQNTQTPAVIFVHGIRSSADSWDPLIKLLKNDPDVILKFEFFRYGYATKGVELSPIVEFPEWARRQEVFATT